MRPGRTYSMQSWMIAPKSVEFFSKQRYRLGDKKSLELQIHEITRIPIAAFQGSPLSQFTIDERMSWVKHRDTKYEEDKVYSLQGIFDIYIPLIYGEGRERALVRLQREIQGYSKGQLLAASQNFLNGANMFEQHRAGQKIYPLLPLPSLSGAIRILLAVE
jgi:hypothetical protein